MRNIMRNGIEIALTIALTAHSGQVDKAGKPYILHPLTVAYNQPTEEGFIVGLLHDAIEDSDYTIENLADFGFSKDILEAVELLTHEKNIDYFEYIKRIKENDLARNVKLADLTHNSDLSRLPVVTNADEIRLKKYKKAMDILLISESEG